jgi:streptomycin 6-kinase
MEGASRLERYVAAWGLAEPRLLGETITSALYTVQHAGETCVLKVLGERETEEQRGAAALRAFGGQGAVRLLRSDEGAQLLEYAAGEELVELVKRGEDGRATEILAEVIGRLHGGQEAGAAAEGIRAGLLPLEVWFGALRAKGAADRAAGIDSIYVRGAEVAGRLLAEAPAVGAQEVRVLHGDIHHYNIRQSARGWLAFDPKGLVGERTYDCANALCNPVLPELVFDGARLRRNAEILANGLGLAVQRVLAYTFAYACLNASQWVARGDGPEMVAWYERVAGVVEEVRATCGCSVRG